MARCSWRRATPPGTMPTDAAELYDPDTGSWTAIANMHARREVIASFVMPTARLLAMARCSAWRLGSAEIYDPTTGTWTALARPTESGSPKALLSDGTVLMAGPWMIEPEPAALYRRGAVRPAHRVVDDRLEHAPVRLTRTPLVHALARRHGPRGRWQRLYTTTVSCVSTGAAELYVPAGVSPPPLPPSRARPRQSSRARPRSRRRSRPRPVPFRRTRGPGRSRSTTRAPSPRRCSWPRRTRADVTARRVRDPERGPSRRHREGDLPLPCQGAG